MRFQRAACLAVALCTALPITATKPAVPDIDTIWATDWSAKRLDHVMTLYAPDAVFYVTEGASRVSGVAAIRALFRKALEVNTPTIHMTRVRAEASGNVAYQSGEYQETIVTAGQKHDWRGQYLIVLRKQGGHWLIVEQMWTGTPAAP